MVTMALTVFINRKHISFACVLDYISYVIIAGGNVFPGTVGISFLK
jgi:hypothetical protein